MKKRLLALLLLGSAPAGAAPASKSSPPRRRAELGAPVTRPVRAAHITAIAPRAEIRADATVTTVDPATVARVFGARISADSKLLGESAVEQHPAWFEIPEPEQRMRRKLSIGPTKAVASGRCKGRGLSVRIPF